MNRLSFRVPVILAITAAIPILTGGCPTSNILCCTEFSVGAEVSTDIGGSAQSQIAVQAIADIGGITSAAVADVTASCRGIATDLGADPTAATAADNETDPDKKLSDWCDLAVKQIGSVKGSATLTINVVPAQCSASLTASADCQAKCDVSGQCDLKANPPTCTGGTLDIDCKGNCTAKAGATLSCTGTCSGNCSGSCTASGSAPSVTCTGGQCSGTCTGAGGAGTNGTQVDGTCQGTCSGSCTYQAGKAPQVQCQGSCDGTCDATCKGSATASVKCSGTCDADYTPVSCTGGTLSGGCQVDAKCQGNCNASVQATATCTPPQVSISFSGSTDLTALQTTLEANLPKIFEVTTKFKLLGDDIGTVSGNFGAVTDIKAACIPVVLSAIGQSVTDAQATLSATASVTTSVGGS